MAAPTQEDLAAAMAPFWHPVATVAELEAADGGVLGVRLLGQDLAVASFGDGEVAALVDRCPHRSTRLSVGRVEGGALRCAYHGWRWAADGRCVEVPSAPGMTIPARFCQRAYSVTARHGLVWVRLDDRAGTDLPALPAADEPGMRTVLGDPYTWPVSAARRIENTVDLAHFAWVHDGTLGRWDEPVPPAPTLERRAGELRFHYDSPNLVDQAATALVGASDYRMPMPLTVDIDFAIAGRPGVRRHLWFTASPVDAGTCRTFWALSRNDGHDEPDDAYLAFQDVVLAEDLPVVTNQVPPELPLEVTEELHVRADRISVEYRRWLAELAVAARRPDAGAALRTTLGLPAAAPVGHRPGVVHQAVIGG